MASRLRENQSFTISILDETQTTLSNYFARQASAARSSTKDCQPPCT
jgi:hypothetical protein